MGVNLVSGRRGPVGYALQIEEPAGDQQADGGHPGRSDHRRRRQVHAPDAMEVGDVDQRVEHGERPDPVAVAKRPLERNRPADVVEDQVAALDFQCVDRRAGPAPERGPAVVDIGPLLGEAEARKVKGHAPQSPIGQQRQHLAV